MKIKKILAVSIILLFLGVAVAPSINTSIVKASQENDLVEVTSQACGIQGYKDTTVKLTREQYQNLEEYLVEFRARLNQTSTREEAVPLFKEAVVELDKYGLLPRGMSVERAQRLVIGPSHNLMFKNLIKKVPKSISLGGIYNIFCLVMGNTSLTFPLTIFGLLPFLSFFNIFIHFLPFQLLGPVLFGMTKWFVPEGSGVDCPAQGSITAIGLLGLTESSGDFYGTLHSFDVEASIDRWDKRYYVGMNMFSGITFVREGMRFYIGFTPCLALNDNPP
ncbi:MAG: hypothetical protein JW840_00330 [Candidatus Thermoplasmatota archaeon]|nr:hypothetical protein [Candidatus Thermoplasmatota archaeon]